MNKNVSNSSTKAQILEAYESVLKKLEEKSTDNPKEVQQRKEAVKTVEAARKNTEDSILSEITLLKGRFVESLDKIQENLVGEYKKLSDIQAAIAIEQKSLQDLYGLTANADSLAAIFLAQKENKELFEQGMKATREKFEFEMAETKLKWEKEKKELTEQLKEEQATSQKNRKREEDEYRYTTQQLRKKEADDYELKKMHLEAELKNKQLHFEKEFAEREKSIVEKEKEVIELRKIVDNLPKELEKAVQSAKSELETRLKTEFNYEKTLLAKENQGLIQLKDLQITTLENKVKEIESQMKLLGQKAETSEKSVKDIAIKAIESSSRIHVVEKEKMNKE